MLIKRVVFSFLSFFVFALNQTNKNTFGLHFLQPDEKKQMLFLFIRMNYMPNIVKEKPLADNTLLETIHTHKMYEHSSSSF